MHKIGISTTFGAQPLSAVIRRCTAPLMWQFSPAKLETVPSHALVWFEGLHAHKEYFEALEGNGWRGPLRYNDLLAWERKDEKRWIKEFDLTPYFSERQIAEAYEFCEEMLEYWTYATKQLPLMLRSAGLGRKLVGASPRDVICSEAASRVCCTSRFDLREWAGKRDHDWINPFRLQQACEKAVATRKGVTVTA